MYKFSVNTSAKTQWIDITGQVQKQLSVSGISEGIALVYVPHTTAAVTINEHADPAVARDVNQRLSELVPENGAYLHTEGNSDGHIKASMLGSSVNIPVSDARLQLGTWQGIFFCEFDGPRSRKVFVKVIGS